MSGVDCKYFESNGYCGYKLKNSRRYKKHLVPKNQAQPCFFFPFGEVGRRIFVTLGCRIVREAKSVSQKYPEILARLE